MQLQTILKILGGMSPPHHPSSPPGFGSPARRCMILRCMILSFKWLFSTCLGFRGALHWRDKSTAMVLSVINFTRYILQISIFSIWKSNQRAALVTITDKLCCKNWFKFFCYTLDSHTFHFPNLINVVIMLLSNFKFWLLLLRNSSKKLLIIAWVCLRPS